MMHINSKYPSILLSETGDSALIEKEKKELDKIRQRQVTITNE